MRKIKTKIFTEAILQVFVVGLLLFTTPAKAKYEAQVPVDLVFALDLSASTNGLIDDLRDKIWDMNNQLARVKPAPTVRFAVVGYSRPSFGAGNQYVKVLVPLTNDVDYVASELYKIRPNIEKGDQFVGAAIRASLDLLEWSVADNAVKQIFLVGNGSVGLGDFNFRESYELAIKKGINVQSFYCYSSLRAKDFPGWREIAKQTGGQAIDIKVHKRLIEINTVSENDFDRLKQLANQLSGTYVYYGKNGADRYKAMASNDRNALTAGKSTFEAMLYHKISEDYQGKQEEWDLVDLIKSRNGKLSNVEAKTLPDSLNKMAPEQLMTRLIQVKERRMAVVNQLRTLLPYDRQIKVEAYLADKKDESGMILEREAMKIILAKLEERGMSLR
jgi:hypothetical protein